MLAALGLFLLVPVTARAWDPIIDSVMYRDPVLPLARVVQVFPERLKALWLEALARPEADLRYKAALTIALAHERGMKGLETAVGPLRQALDRPDQPPGVPAAIARALIALDARQAADDLFRQAQAGDSALRDLVEPALARWHYEPARKVWLERLAGSDLQRHSLLLAIRGLAVLGEEKASPRLRELVLAAHAPPPVRVEAARALGTLHTSGLEKDARALTAGAASPSSVASLAAALLLRHHQGDEAIRLLQGLAQGTEPAAAAVALDRLVAIDPGLVVPVLKPVLASPDATVRSIGVEVLCRKPTAEHLRLLGDRLDDPHPAVRRKARQGLRELARKPPHREAVIRQGERLLAGRDWRGQEQAALLLAQLDHKAVAGRLVELLRVERPEVLVAAAWGLRQLAVPATLPAVLDYLRAPTRPAAGSAKPRMVPAEDLGQQLSQLAQFLGQSRYQPADAALRQLYPRYGASIPGDPEARAAAIWALGRIHEGKPDADLVQGFVERLSDVNTPAGNEDYRVRWMAAVGLARMRAVQALAALRRFYSAGKPTDEWVNNACGWAIQQLTGEAMPPAGTLEVVPGGWFLNPLGA